MAEVVHKLFVLKLGDFCAVGSGIEQVDQRLTPRYQFFLRIVIFHCLQTFDTIICVMVLHVLQIWSPQVLAIAVMETFDMLNQVIHGGDLELVLSVASVLQTAQLSDKNKLPATIAQSAVFLKKSLGHMCTSLGMFPETATGMTIHHYYLTTQHLAPKAGPSLLVEVIACLEQCLLACIIPTQQPKHCPRIWSGTHQENL